MTQKCLLLSIWSIIRLSSIFIIWYFSLLAICFYFFMGFCCYFAAFSLLRNWFFIIEKELNTFGVVLSFRTVIIICFCCCFFYIFFNALSFIKISHFFRTFRDFFVFFFFFILFVCILFPCRLKLTISEIERRIRSQKWLNFVTAHRFFSHSFFSSVQFAYLLGLCRKWNVLFFFLLFCSIPQHIHLFIYCFNELIFYHFFSFLFYFFFFGSLCVEFNRSRYYRVLW